MPMFQKRPVIVEAFQMTRERRQDNSDWPEWLHRAWCLPNDQAGSLFPEDFPDSDGKDRLKIFTLEGAHLVDFDDWIIKGVKGEIYACKPDIFALSYEPLPID